MTELQARAEEALRTAGVEPPAAVALAERVVAEARQQRAWGAVSLAERALGVAAMQQSRLDDAVRHLRSAVAHGRRAGAPRCSGEARMSLASALLLCGRPRQSFRQIDLALQELDGVHAARARTQRAAILQELGRLDEALHDLRQALPVLRRSEDVQWGTRALSNRGLLRISRREFAAAHKDLLAAQELCREHGLRLPGAIVEHNLAWLESQRGDVPAALRHLTGAEEMFQALEISTASILTDRAELLLSVRLLREAQQTAVAAVAANARSGRANHLPESELLLSTIALVSGDHQTALEAAQSALDRFRRLGRREWEALARFARIQALAASGGQVSAGQCRRSAEELERAGWRVPALEARLLAATVALARGRVREARQDLAAAGRVRRVGPADARARAWLGEAMLREAEGNRTGAVAALRAGLRVLEDYRHTMGATELRAHVTLHRGSIARRGLRLALQSGDPRQVLWWVESTRATATLLRQAHPPADPVLADLLADLRAVVSRIEEERAAGQRTTALDRRQVALERRIRDHTRRSPATGHRAGGGPVPVRQLQGSLAGRAMLAYLATGGRLLAVTVTERRVRLHDLGAQEPVTAELRYAAFAMRRLAAGTATRSRSEAAAATLARAGRRLDERLLAPLRAETGERALVVVPDAALQGVPWSVLPSCAGRPVSVSPSATLWHDAATRAAPGSHRLAVVAGPGLPGARAEAAAVAGHYPGARAVVGEEATARNVAAALDGAGLAHLSAHGVVRADNPMFSSLTLADGPFTVYDLERLRRAPRHVVLAACDTGHSAVVADGEILGFTAALMTGGTTTLVAPVVPVGDVETVGLMVAYHDQLGGGLPPAAALAAAQQTLAATGEDRATATAASFVCLGYGHDPVPSLIGPARLPAEAPPPTTAGGSAVTSGTSRSPYLA